MSKPLTSKLDELLETGELLDIVDNSLSCTEVLLKLGYAKKGQYIKVVSDYLKNNDIIFDHFTSNGKPKNELKKKVCPVCGGTFTAITRSNGAEQVTCSKGCSNTYFRSGKNHPSWREGSCEKEIRNYRAKAFEVYPKVCMWCGYDKNEAAIVVHHMDKDRSNNDIDNLVVLCANCHAIEHWGTEDDKKQIMGI